MRKGFTYLLMLVAALLIIGSDVVSAQTLTDSWSAAPAWNNSSYYRGFAYGNNRLYVAGRPAGTASVEVINSLTGGDVKSLDHTGILDLTFDLADAEFSNDGSILAAPLTLNASAETGWGAGFYTIYRWADEMSKPEPFIVYKGAGRIDMFTVVGDVTGNGTVMGGVSATRTVWGYAILGGVISDAIELTLDENIATGAVGVVYPAGLTPADGFWYNNDAITPTLCNDTGGVVGAIPAELFTGNTGQIKAFTYDSKSYLLVADDGKAKLINITGKQPGELTVDDIVHTTQGVYNINQDVDYRIGADGSLAIFSFSANNGIYSASTEAAPVASDPAIDGLTLVDQIVTAAYTYGDLNGDLEGASEIKWYIADDAEGTNKAEIVANAGNTTYTIVAGDMEKFISFSVLAVAATGTASEPSYLAESNWYGPIAAADAKAPVASDLAIAGPLAVDEELVASYTYSDENGDPEGASVLTWFAADDAAGTNKAQLASDTLKYKVLPADAGKFILFEVTPVATSGVLLEGETVFVASDSAVFFPDFLPVASELAIAGREEVDGTLTGSYVYSDLNGDEEGPTLLKWYRADDATGTNQVEVATDTLTYTLVADDEGKYMLFEVTPVTADTVAGDPASVSTGAIAAKPAPEAPVASDVTLHGTPEVGVVLYGSYTYSDRTDDPEGESIHKWYTADDAAGANKAEIASAAGSYVLLVTEDLVGKHIGYEITPVATEGELLEGEPVLVVSASAAVASTNDGDFERMWMRAAKVESLAEYIGTGSTERGFAVGEDHIYVASRNGGTKLLVVDKTNGALISHMDTEGMNVGLFPISDVEVSSDGQILACPLQLNSSTEPFVVYKWSDELAAPTRFIEYTSTAAMRLGDKFTVIGDVSGDAVIYAVASAGNTVVRWVVTGGIVDTGTEITLENVTSVGSTPAAAPLTSSPESDFIVDGRGFQAQIFDKDGKYISAIEEVGQSGNQSNSPTVFYYKGRTLAAFHQKNDGGQWNILVKDITAVPHITVGASEILSTANQELGGVHVEVDADYFRLYMLSANYGIALFQGLLELPEADYSETNEAGDAIMVWFTKNMTDSVGNVTGWTVMVNDVEVSIDTIYGTGTDPEVLTLELGSTIAEGDMVTVAYDGTGSVTAFDGMPLNGFDALEVVNIVGAAAPAATDVTVTGDLFVGSSLTGSYTYSDANGDLEEGSSYQWYYASDAAGSDALKLLGENGTSYVVTDDMRDKYVAFEVTPATTTGGLDYLVGEAARSGFVQISTVGMELGRFASISVYPNPFNGILTVENCNSFNHITIIDVTGKVQMQFETLNENRIELNMERFQKGVYFMKLTNSDGGTETFRLIKVQ